MLPEVSHWKWQSLINEMGRAKSPRLRPQSKFHTYYDFYLVCVTHYFIDSHTGQPVDADIYLIWCIVVHYTHIAYQCSQDVIDASAIELCNIMVYRATH